MLQQQAPRGGACRGQGPHSQPLAVRRAVRPWPMGRRAATVALSASAAPAPAVAPRSGHDADFDSFVSYILDLQKDIIGQAEALEGGQRSFVHDRWERDASNPNAGYGITCVLEDGKVLEKAAANITVVRGKLSAQRAAAMSSRGRTDIDPSGGQDYAAAAMSLVFHSANPFIPTLRADVRLFQVAGQAWLGGGCDLTPNYLDEQDVRSFHSYWKGVCDKHSPALYQDTKAWCDRYFYIPARKEHRGVGGIFFDDFSSQELGYDVEAFVRQVGSGILPSWLPIVARHRDQPYTDQQRQWQLLRRGRYLEFNLLYDRGVKFGLDGGRIESIMVSAPPLIAWRYNVEPVPGSEEGKMMAVLRAPQEWV